MLCIIWVVEFALCTSLSGNFNQKLISIKGCLPLNVIVYQGSSSVEGHLPLRAIFHCKSSFVKGCLRSKLTPSTMPIFNLNTFFWSLTKEQTSWAGSATLEDIIWVRLIIQLRLSISVDSLRHKTTLKGPCHRNKFFHISKISTL